MNEIDSAFGYWFAGLTDGEGSFMIRRENNSRHGYRYTSYTYYPVFGMNLRLDEAPILQMVASQLSLGSVYTATAKLTRSKGINKSDQAFFVVVRKPCLSIVNLFRQYPLRTLKQQDFELWAEAVEIYCTGNRKALKEYKTSLEGLRRTRTTAALTLSLSRENPQMAKELQQITNLNTLDKLPQAIRMM